MNSYEINYMVYQVQICDYHGFISVFNRERLSTQIVPRNSQGTTKERFLSDIWGMMVVIRIICDHWNWEISFFSCSFQKKNNKIYIIYISPNKSNIYLQLGMPFAMVKSWDLMSRSLMYLSIDNAWKLYDN